MPVKTFLNCTMPALVNSSVGSLRGTSGLDATTSWPLRRKKSRKLARMSLPVLMVFMLVLRPPGATGCAPCARQAAGFSGRTAAPQLAAARLLGGSEFHHVRGDDD